MQGFTLWLIGLPDSGKTTLAQQLLPALERLGFRAEILDMEMLKRESSFEFGTSSRENDFYLRLIIYLCSRLNHHGIVAIVDSIFLPQSLRFYAHQKNIDLVEIFVECSTEFYRKIHQDTLGVSHEIPTQSEILINAEMISSHASVAQVIQELTELGFLGADEAQDVVLTRLQALGYVS